MIEILFIGGPWDGDVKQFNEIPLVVRAPLHPPPTLPAKIEDFSQVQEFVTVASMFTAYNILTLEVAERFYLAVAEDLSAGDAMRRLINNYALTTGKIPGNSAHVLAMVRNGSIWGNEH